MSKDSKDDEQETLIQIIHDIIQIDMDLRTKYEIADKFRFVRDRLQALLLHLETDRAAQLVLQKPVEVDEPDDILVYVYLYNARGHLRNTWSSFLMPKLFNEYGVNRPIYTEKSHVEALIRSRKEHAQHAYLTIKVKTGDILSKSTPDGLGNPTVKVKEGALRFEKLIWFTHNERDFKVGEQGELLG